MLTKRIIPCLDVDAGRVVKGVHFKNLQEAGDPLEQAKFYDEAGADELVFLDITASHEKRKTILDVVERVASAIFLPLTVGGGIRSVEDIRDLLNAGADKVSINTVAVERHELLTEGAARFGSQCIVIAIDARRDPKKQAALQRGEEVPEAGFWKVYTHGGRKPTGRCALKWAEEAVRCGAGEVLLTSMDCDGTKEGYDIDLTCAISERVPVPVIASGGAGTLEHFYEVLAFGKADAVLAASLFHYREISIAEVKHYLHGLGIPVRLENHEPEVD